MEDLMKGILNKALTLGLLMSVVSVRAMETKSAVEAVSNVASEVITSAVTEVAKPTLWASAKAKAGSIYSWIAATTGSVVESVKANPKKSIAAGLAIGAGAIYASVRYYNNPTNTQARAAKAHAENLKKLARPYEVIVTSLLDGKSMDSQDMNVALAEISSTTDQQSYQTMMKLINAVTKKKTNQTISQLINHLDLMQKPKAVVSKPATSAKVEPKKVTATASTAKKEAPKTEAGFFAKHYGKLIAAPILATGVAYAVYAKFFKK